ncbi:MAG TPA: hypothetical protein DER01_00635 [Phycisphaerales bacterium]|nr:hypothetical protein [Phycisphaerales bacterium]
MNWTSHLPVWALRMQANRDMPLADEAWRLLGDRLNPNTKLSTSLSTSQIQSLITDVLALQADTKHPWRYEAGVFLEGARMWDMVNDQDWNAYVKTAYQQAISFHIRPNVNHGEDIPIALRSDNFRLGTFGIRYHYGQGTFSIDGQVIRSEPIGFGACVNAHHYSDKGWSDLVRLTDKQWQDIKPGEHQFKVQMRVFLLDTRHSSGLVSDYNLLSQEQIDALPDVAYCDQSFEKTFNILPTDAVDAVSITPEDHRKAVESAFTVNYLEYQPNRGRWVLRGWISNLPVNLACDILICFGDKTYPLSSIKIKGPIPSGSRVSYLANGWEPKLNDLTLEKVDLRLVPSRKVAQRTIDMKEYWGDEILIKDVPVVIENDAQ